MALFFSRPHYKTSIYSQIDCASGIQLLCCYKNQIQDGCLNLLVYCLRIAEFESLLLMLVFVIDFFPLKCYKAHIGVLFTRYNIWNIFFHVNCKIFIMQLFIKKLQVPDFLGQIRYLKHVFSHDRKFPGRRPPVAPPPVTTTMTTERRRGPLLPRPTMRSATVCHTLFTNTVSIISVKTKLVYNQIHTIFSPNIH